MNTEHEPQANTEAPDGRKDDRDFSGSPFYPKDRPDLSLPVASVSGETGVQQTDSEVVVASPADPETTSSDVWDKIDVARADETRHSMGSAAVNINRP